ncbi:DUF4870 domain-containing protein [Croceiramulus getboli]|nr:hypothetical protein P8624_10505 [Flavobacteriaceae bacterium YJPT1-3]
MNEQLINEGKTTAVVAYLTIIGALIALFMNMEPKNPFARFHIRQAFGIHITYLALGLLIGFFDNWAVSIGFYIFIIALWIYGLVNAFQNSTTPVPLLGTYFQKWFQFIQ